MSGDSIDVISVVLYFVVLLGIGMYSGRGKRDTAGHYFVSKGMLPWWVIGAAYVTTGLNSEQLIGMNGMGYLIGLPVANSYLIAIIVYTALIYVFFPLYLRNNIVTLPQYLGRRFDIRSQNVFSVLLLLSYIFLSLAVVLYGGAKLFEGVYGVPVWLGVLLLGVIAGIYTMYGGMTSMVNAAVFQFILMFVAGGVLFVLGYMKLPNGWHDIVNNAPCGFHLMKPTDYPVMPWHAVLFALFNLQLFYSCMNQALVQRGFGAKTEWDVRMAIVFAGVFVLFRLFLEIFPGMMARALAQTGFSEFLVPKEEIDMVFPLLITHLVPAGLKGLILIGILASVMSTISAFLNSISTLFTYDIYKKWINTQASDKKLVRVGVLATLILVLFSIAYAPMIGKFGGIFLYFQSVSAYLSVPVATVFLFGMFWKRTTPAAALTIMIGGIPLGLLIQMVIIPGLFSPEMIEKYSLTNFYVTCGITQFFCVWIIVGVSLITSPKPLNEVRPLLWTVKYLRLPVHEPKRPFWQSVWLWWGLLAVIYIAFYISWW
ncbi:MAG: sodium/solute symporter [Bacteroidota bacterium]